LPLSFLIRLFRLRSTTECFNFIQQPDASDPINNQVFQFPVYFDYAQQTGVWTMLNKRWRDHCSVCLDFVQQSAEILIAVLFAQCLKPKPSLAEQSQNDG